MSKPLMKCPFCGGASHLEGNERGESENPAVWIECTKCQARGPVSEYSWRAHYYWCKAVSAGDRPDEGVTTPPLGREAEGE